MDKVLLLEQVEMKMVNLYELDGRYDYFYGHMSKRTSDIKAFDLMYYDNGFILRRPNDYENFTLQSDYYDAIIVNLGSGEGDNWWCVVYPPLCFVNKTNTSAQNIQYQSYLMEIVKKYFD